VLQRVTYMAAGLHISISAETLFNVGGLEISNSILTSLIASAVLIAFGFAVRASLKNTTKPTGLQNFAEWIMEGLIGLVDGVTGSQKKTNDFLPFVATFFFFIIVNNWLGLLPGVGTIGFMEGEAGHAYLQPSTVSVSTPQAYAATPVDTHTNTAPADTTHEESINRDESTHVESGESLDHAEAGEAAGHGPTFVPYFRAGTADLNTTFALAIISVFMTQVFGFKYNNLGYLKKYFNFSSPIMFFIGILELVSEFSKILSFSFRLFGNVFAGEVLLAVIAFLAALVVPMPFYGLEIFVGFIQALVFALLSVVFFNMATISHDDH